MAEKGPVTIGLLLLALPWADDEEGTVSTVTYPEVVKPIADRAGSERVPEAAMAI